MLTAPEGATSAPRTHDGLATLATIRGNALRSLNSAELPPMIIRRPSGFIAPCLPSKIARPPPGPLWVHEIKQDGYRLMVRRDGMRVRCVTATTMTGPTASRPYGLQRGWPGGLSDTE
jgi:ATP-dependent DNA ligase